MFEVLLDDSLHYVFYKNIIIQKSMKCSELFLCLKEPWIDLPVVNFINILRVRFSYESASLPKRN